MAQLQFTRRALRDIRKLPPKVQRRIEIALDALIEDTQAGDLLHGDRKGYWRLRPGDYRIIYRITEGNTVEIQYLRHRRTAYRP